MILITGGSFQGKREFAARYSEMKKGAGAPAVWTDGGEASWTDFVKAGYCCGLNLFVRRVLEGSVKPEENWESASGVESMGNAVLAKGEGGRVYGNRGDERGRNLQLLLTGLLSGPPDRIIVTDEIGCGIVPLDPFERLYREETGRLCCRIAAGAEEVWRVCCGLGMRIK